MGKSRGLKNAGGVYPGRLNQADFNEMIHTAGTLPLRRDFVTLLTYVRESRVVGTQSTGNMQLKSVREVTARFVEPPVLDTEIGNRIYRLRSEEDVWPLYFLHILAEVGGLLKTPRAKQWRLTRMGVNFLDLNAMQQVVYLLNTWWYQVNWLVAYPVQGLGDNLPPGFQSITLSRLDALPVGNAVKFESFASGLIKGTNLTWSSQNLDYAPQLLQGSIERIVVKILRQFGMLETEYTEKPLGTGTTQELETFKINRFGKELLGSLKLMGAGLI
ncbi:MAG: hypothetical protein AB8G77_24580 [Rhodothermales bacterium]